MKNYVKVVGFFMLMFLFTISFDVTNAQTNSSNLSCPTFTKSLSVGSRGQDVADLQTFLISNGFDIPAISRDNVAKGYFGPATVVALAKYQAKVGLPAVGKLGPLTIAKVKTNCSGTVTNLNTNTPVIAFSTTTPSTGGSGGGSGPISVGGTCYSFSRNLTIGDSGTDVANLQKFLMNKGFDIPAISQGDALPGYFGPATATALKGYQTSVGIQATGFLGPLTIASINADCGGTSDVSVKVISNSIELSYDGDREALLTSVYKVEIYGGSSGVYIYRSSGNYEFINSSGSASNPNSVVRSGLVSGSSVRTVTDQYGGVLYVIPAGETIVFTSTIAVDPKQMFAGVYYGSLMDITATPNSTNVNTYYKIKVPSNKTNSIVIVGEYSPYITSVTNPVKVGEKFSINGQRLSAQDTVYIDGVAMTATFDGSRDGSVIWTNSFPNLSSGVHNISVRNRINGESNKLTFEVQNGSVTPTPSITVLSPNGGESYSSLDSIKFVGSINYSPKQLVAYLYSPINGNVAELSPDHKDFGGNFQGSFSGDPGIGLGQYKITVCDVLTDDPRLPGKSLCDSSDNYFTVISSTNRPPVINGTTAPSSLKVGETGTWTVRASDPENGPLSYSVDWGDNGIYANNLSQTSTFTHSYNSFGTYTVRFTVTDSAGLTAQTSMTVSVSDLTPTPYTCPAGYTCAPVGYTPACPSGFTCNPSTITNCPAGFTCWTTTPTKTETTKYPDGVVTGACISSNFYGGLSMDVSQGIVRMGGKEYTISKSEAIQGPDKETVDVYAILNGTTAYYDKFIPNTYPPRGSTSIKLGTVKFGSDNITSITHVHSGCIPTVSSIMTDTTSKASIFDGLKNLFIF